MYAELKRRREQKMRWILPALLLVGAGGLYLGARPSPVHAPAARGTAEQTPRIASGGSAKPTRQHEVSVVRSLPSPPVVSGRVQTTTGVALEGARVCVAPANAACCESMSCTLSDSDGQFALENRGQLAPTLFASRAGYLPLSQALPGPIGAAPVLLTLRAGGVRVTGNVVDAAGGPIAGAWLSAINPRDEVLALAISDDAGLFRLDVASGVMRISARADGYSEQVRQIRAPLAGVKLALAAASSIVGRAISEETGLPVKDVRVTAQGQDGLRAAARAAQTAEDGTFRLNGLPAGRYALVAVSEHWRSDERSVHLGVAQVTAPIDLMLRAATRLTAVVKVAGAPCEEGAVSLSGAVGGYAPLAQAGRAVFDGLIPGRYRVSVECEAGLDQSDWLDLGLEPVTRVWDLPQGQRLTGVALTPAGAPLVGVPIEVNPIDEPFGRTTVHCTTGERGEFSCAGLVPGDYECAIGYGLPLRSDSVRVAVSEEPPPPVILHAHGEGAIRVRIEDPDQFELEALPLVARGKAGAVLGELEGDEFVFEPLALGSYEVANESSPPGSGRLVELTREGQVVELMLAMPSPQTLSGRVLGDDGQGVPDAWVRASLASFNALARPVTPVLTDAEGAFALTGLLPGSYRLAVSSREGEAQLDEVASDSRDVLVRLPSYGSLAVSLRSAAGGPVGDFVVAYRRSEDERSEQAPGFQGAWSAPWVAPGSYELTAKAAEGSVTKTVELAPGGEVSVALRLDRQPRESAPHASESSAGAIGAGR